MGLFFGLVWFGLVWFGSTWLALTWPGSGLVLVFGSVWFIGFDLGWVRFVWLNFVRLCLVGFRFDSVSVWFERGSVWFCFVRFGLV